MSPVDRLDPTRRRSTGGWTTVHLLPLVLFLSVVLAPRANGDESASAPSPGTFRIAFTRAMFTSVNVSDAQAAIKTWFESMTGPDGLPIRTETKVVDGAAGICAALTSRQADGVVATAAEFLQIERDVELSPIFTGTWNGDDREEYLLLVHRDGPVHELGDLRGGKTVLWQSHRTSLAEEWLKTLRAENGLNAVPDPFGTITRSTKLSAVVLPVFFRQADACVVTRLGWETLTELNPQVGAQLRPLATSAPLVTVVVSLRNDFRSPSRETIEAGLRDMKNNPTGRQVLLLFHGDGMKESPSSILDSARNLQRAAAGLPPLSTSDAVAPIDSGIAATSGNEP